MMRLGNRKHRSRPKPRRVIVAVAGAALAESLALWVRSGRFGGNVIVRCRQGHLFTTLWIPAASVKAIRLGLWRVQHCPVGRHWTVVAPVREASLGDEERRAARELHDIWLP